MKSLDETRNKFRDAMAGLIQRGFALIKRPTGEVRGHELVTAHDAEVGREMLLALESARKLIDQIHAFITAQPEAQPGKPAPQPEQKGK